MYIHTKSLVDVKDYGHFKTVSNLLKDIGYQVFQLGLEDDPNLEGVEKLTLPLKELMTRFSNKECDLFIGLDSGLSFIAAAYGTPCIVILGATNKTTSGPWGENVKILQSVQHERCFIDRKGVRCHGIMNGKCGFGEKCINSINPGEILKLAQQVLNK